MDILSKDKKSPDKGKPNDGPAPQSEGVSSRIVPGALDYLAGEASGFNKNLKPYLPQDLIGGAIPHIPGAEEEAVWNAASQACGTEKVHYAYTVEDERCWYIACPSASLASNPDSWCPLAAALPGNGEFWDKETVYLYEQEGIASALRWDPDTGRMQVFVGASRTLLPRIQSMDANFVTINADVADTVPWQNRMLRTEKLSRATARTLLNVGIGANLVIAVFFVFQFVLANTVERDLEKVKRETDEIARKLAIQAHDALQSDTIKHMVRVQELLDELRELGGTLLKYEVSKNKVVWEALVPQAYSGSVGGHQARVEVVLSKEKDGRARIRGFK